MPAAGKFSRLGTRSASRQGPRVTESVINAQALPLILDADDEVDLPAWIRLNRDSLRRKLYRHGALLFRTPRGIDFDAFTVAFSDAQVDYRGGAAIRSRVNTDTYTASEYPEELEIRLHSEFCYSYDWPMILLFHCDVAPRDRGQTPLVDNRQVFLNMPEQVRRLFAERGLTYMRGYGYNRTWQRSYETQSRADVEALCAAEGRRCEWIGDDQLRTYEKRAALAEHPVTGERVWFNYAHGFHISRMDDGIRQALSTSEEDTDEQLWPNNVFWGDGTEIESGVIDVANEVVARLAVQFDWRAGDTLVVDNMVCGHGRRPYSGPRRILLKMAESFRAVQSGASS